MDHMEARLREYASGNPPQQVAVWAVEEITRLREELEKSVAYELASRTLTDVANRRADAAEARVEEITRLREELEDLKGINLKREDAYSELLIRADALDAAKGE